MPKQVALVLLVEIALVVLTSLLLMQPSLFFGSRSDGLKMVAKNSGLVLLCLTFCWSVFLGCVMALNAISIRV